jgi:hypothetical protein
MSDNSPLGMRTHGKLKENFEFRYTGKSCFVSLSTSAHFDLITSALEQALHKNAIIS